MQNKTLFAQENIFANIVCKFGPFCIILNVFNLIRNGFNAVEDEIHFLPNCDTKEMERKQWFSNISMANNAFINLSKLKMHSIDFKWRYGA